MSKRYQRGLVVGKFSPLHLGHELVIGRALELCREVVLISYSNPEYPGCEAATRDQWLAALFPQARRLVLAADGDSLSVPLNEADDSAHRQFTALLCRQTLGVSVDAVFTSEEYGNGFADELTRAFRRWDPGAAAVEHVLVDRERNQIQISGTHIRTDVHAHRQWLSPVVYASFVRRVCLLGGESSGKSTLAEGLARKFATEFVPEYGRTLWEEQNGALTYENMLEIAKKQVVAEEAALLQAKRYLFCDTSPLTTLYYSRRLFGRADSGLEKLAERRYDLVLLCAPDFEFVQDGTRQDEAFRRDQHEWYELELKSRRVDFSVICGSADERVRRVEEILEKVLCSSRGNEALIKKA